MNIKYGSNNRRVRCCIIWLLAIILILLAFGSMVTLKNYTNNLKEELQIESSSCPSLIIDLKNDYLLENKVQEVSQANLDSYFKRQAYD